MSKSPLTGADKRGWRQPCTRLLGALVAALSLAAPFVAVGTAPGAGAQGATTVPAIEGQPFSGQLAAFTIDCAAGSATGSGTISWGDGSSSPAQFSQPSTSELDLSGSHTYLEEGSFSGSVAGTWSCGSAPHSFSVMFDAQVADAPLNASGQPVNATTGQAFSGPVATFTDSDPSASAGDYSASIAWGDGTAGAGTVGATGSGFVVLSSHTYAMAGKYTATVTIRDTGGSQTSATSPVVVSTQSPPLTTSTTVTQPPPVTTSTTVTVPPPPPIPQASFTAPPSAVSGQAVTLDASGSRQSGASIATFKWTVDGRQLANCAGPTSEVVTRTLPVGVDAIRLTVVGSSGATGSVTHTLSVSGPGPTAKTAAPWRVREFQLPMEAECLSGPGDPTGVAVAPKVLGAPGNGCTLQVQSGIVDAVGCMTEHQDTVDVLNSDIKAGYKTFSSYATVVAGPDGLPARPGTNLAGVASSADSQTILSEVGEQIGQQLGGNGGLGSACSYLQELLSEALAQGDQQQAQEWSEQLKQDLCAGVPDGSEQTPVGVEGGSNPSALGGAHAPEQWNVQATEAVESRGVVARAGHMIVQALSDGCSPTPVPSGQTYGNSTVSTFCLDLFVANGKVRMNGVDYEPSPGGELVIAPQFNLVVSQSASGSLDGLLLNPSHPYQPINYLLPASPESDPSMDFPALSVGDLKQTIAQQPQQNKEAASQVVDALSNVGGFLSAGGLQVSFEDDTAIIYFAVQLPEPFNGDGGPVTAQVVARVGASEPFHVVYGYLGSSSGGANIDLGPFQLNNFGICYREQYSTDSNTGPSNPDPHVDPCQRVTGIDDSGFGNDTWLASGDLNITGALDVLFRPGPDFTSKGCSKSVPLGFAFTGGHLAQAGGFVDVSGGGVPLVPGLVMLTGFGGGFSQHTNPQTGGQYETFGGCLTFNVVGVLEVAADLFGVETSNGYHYSFSHDELSPCTLPEVGGSYPYTDHLGIGACGSLSLTLPGPVTVPLAKAYALYVDDSGGAQHQGAVFFGGGACFAIPSGDDHDCHNPPGTGIALGAEVDGAIGLGTGTPFDFEGDANVTAEFSGFTVLAGQAQALVSHGPSGTGGIGVCGTVSLFNGAIYGSGGFAYPWHENVGDFLSNAFFNHQGVVFSTDKNQPACDLDWLNGQIGVNVQAQVHEARAGEAKITGTQVAVTVARGVRVLNVDLKGAGGAPDVTVRGPNGASASTAGARLGQAVRTSGFTLVRVPQLDETFIAPNQALAGTYLISANPGSPAISHVMPMEGVTPAVKAHVAGRGEHRRLVYTVRREPGETVLFYQVSAQVDTLLGTTHGGHGSIPFSATAGTGRRQIIAQVYINGAPQARTVVGGYLAPGLRRLGRAHAVRVSRRGGRVTVTFAAVPGATRYHLYMALSNGTRQMLVTNARRAVFSPVFLDASGTITVRPLGDGVYTASGPATRGRFAAAVRTTIEHKRRR